MKPGAHAMVKVVANRNFIVAESAPEKSPKGVSKTGTSATKANTVGRSKQETGLEKQDRLGGHLLVTQTTRFKALIPFSLRIEGSGLGAGLWGPSAASASGKIKPPGKK